jgi:hypothetical protein
MGPWVLSLGIYLCAMRALFRHLAPPPNIFLYVQLPLKFFLAYILDEIYDLQANVNARDIFIAVLKKIQRSA